MKIFDVYPVHDIAMTKALGTRVIDSKGQEYLDLYGGHAVISIGHSHPHWVRRITDQLNNVAFYSNSIVIKQQHELAELLGRISGKEDYQLFLCNSGAEANENALKLASFATGRKKIISFKRGFHGRTSLAVSVTDNPSIIAPVNENPNAIMLPFNDEEALQAAFNKDGNEICAVIVEGIQGIGGIHEATDSFLRKIRSLCDSYGAFYIADAVQCGYGRSGQFFSHDQAGVDADVYTMAKGMGNGFPVGGIIIAPQHKPKYGMLGTTYGGNHLACAAALGVLEVMEEEELMKNAASLGIKVIEKLKTYPLFKNVRGRGLMIGFDLDDKVKDIRSKLLHDHKIFTGVAKPNVVRLLPSLAVGQNEFDVFFKAVDVIMDGLKG